MKGYSYILLSLITLSLLFLIPGYYTSQTVKKVASSIDNTYPIPVVENPIQKQEIIIQVADTQFHATLMESVTKDALLQLLPLTISMQDMNANEKYYYFSSPFPSNPENVEEIQAGDIMLFGSDCLVIFYESFTTTYSYTRLGHIKDITNLKKALGHNRIDLSIFLSM